MAYRPYEKLAPKFYGPFEVLQRIRLVAYRLNLPRLSKIHLVFDISQLKRAIGSSVSSTTIRAQLNPEPGLVTAPKAVVDIRKVKNGSQSTLEVLVKWYGSPLFEATWEAASEIEARFPEFHLEDKEKLWAPGYVMNDNNTKQLICIPRKSTGAKTPLQCRRGKKEVHMKKKGKRVITEGDR